MDGNIYLKKLQEAYYRNGGTSALYIDFTPSEKGTCGQIVRYLHDPDEIEVIADSFDAFLDMIVESGMIFLDPDDFR